MLNYDLSKFSADELSQINRVVLAFLKQKRNQEIRKVTAGLGAGDIVSFTDRSGYTRTAEVIKVKPKMVEVVETPKSTKPGMRWNVQGNLLKLVK